MAKKQVYDKHYGATGPKTINTPAAGQAKVKLPKLSAGGMTTTTTKLPKAPKGMKMPKGC